MAKRSRSSIQDNLLVATESTRGLKATNEDRACSVRVEDNLSHSGKTASWRKYFRA